MKRSAKTADEQFKQTLAAYFCKMSGTVGLPRSVALIYHSLFLSPAPLCFADIVNQSGLSKASASTGLKLLERMGGVEAVFVPDDRRTFYRAELSLRRIIQGFIRESLQPGMDAGQCLLDEAAALPATELSPICIERLASLRHWHSLTKELLPALSTLDPVN
jgi:DNA-binding transcriptional regulator GbsR (MarR family)